MTDAPTDGCRMVQEVVREFGKKKKAADQSKKAGSTRKDAHPGDNRGMMSQGNHKGKRSGYTVQRTVSTTVRTQGGSPAEPSKGTTIPTQEALWSPARTYLGAQRIILTSPHLPRTMRDKNARSRPWPAIRIDPMKDRLLWQPTPLSTSPSMMNPQALLTQVNLGFLLGNTGPSDPNKPQIA